MSKRENCVVVYPKGGSIITVYIKGDAFQNDTRYTFLERAIDVLIDVGSLFKGKNTESLKEIHILKD